MRTNNEDCLNTLLKQILIICQGILNAIVLIQIFRTLLFLISAGSGRHRRSGFHALTFNKDIHAVLLTFSNQDILGSDLMKPNSLHIVQVANLAITLSKLQYQKLIEYGSQTVTFTMFQLMEEAEARPEAAVAMETQKWTLQDLAHAKLVFDASEVFQSWILDESFNHGLRIECDLCHKFGLEFTNDDVKLSVEVDITDNQAEMTRRASMNDSPLFKSNSGSKRIDCPIGNSSKKKPRCCRESMKVDFSQLTGFEFIQRPMVFDAFKCQGRCPLRFNAQNDHTVLQSLMHIKTKHYDKEDRVHRPCCIGTKFEPLDILHVDDRDPTKLKVTHWKNVIVSECGCL